MLKFCIFAKIAENAVECSALSPWTRAPYGEVPRCRNSVNFHFLAFSASLVRKPGHARTHSDTTFLFFIKMEVLFFTVMSPLPPSRRSTRTGR